MEIPFELNGDVPHESGVDIVCHGERCFETGIDVSREIDTEAGDLRCGIRGKQCGGSCIDPAERRTHRIGSALIILIGIHVGSPDPPVFGDPVCQRGIPLIDVFQFGHADSSGLSAVSAFRLPVVIVIASDIPEQA